MRRKTAEPQTEAPKTLDQILETYHSSPTRVVNGAYTMHEVTQLPDLCIGPPTERFNGWKAARAAVERSLGLDDRSPKGLDGAPKTVRTVRYPAPSYALEVQTDDAHYVLLPEPLRVGRPAPARQPIKMPPGAPKAGMWRKVTETLYYDHAPGIADALTTALLAGTVHNWYPGHLRLFHAGCPKPQLTKPWSMECYFAYAYRVSRVEAVQYMLIDVTSLVYALMARRMRYMVHGTIKAGQPGLTRFYDYEDLSALGQAAECLTAAAQRTHPGGVVFYVERDVFATADEPNAAVTLPLCRLAYGASDPSMPDEVREAYTHVTSAELRGLVPPTERRPLPRRTPITPV